MRAVRAVSFAAICACVALLWTSSASSAVEVSVSMMAADVSYLQHGNKYKNFNSGKD
jgi:hypothetical protein